MSEVQVLYPKTRPCLMSNSLSRKYIFLIRSFPFVFRSDFLVFIIFLTFVCGRLGFMLLFRMEFILLQRLRKFMYRFCIFFI